MPRPTPEQLEQIAHAAHEVNRAWCVMNGDTSQLPWESAPDWQRASAITGVTKIASGEIIQPHQSHESWSKQKLEEGWTYGPVKDPVAKTHHCLVPFDELPPVQQVKDVLFFNTTVMLLDALNASLD